MMSTSGAQGAFSNVSITDHSWALPSAIIEADNLQLGRPLHRKTTIARKRPDFNPHAFLSTIGKGRAIVSYEKKHTIFAQGDSTHGLFFIQSGKVLLSVVSEAGKEATLGILSEGDFFGEGGLAGQLIQMSSAVALTDCVVLRIQKNMSEQSCVNFKWRPR